MLLVSSMVLAGCFGDGDAIVEMEEVKPAWNDYVLIDEKTHEMPREFMTVDLRSNETTNMTWAVFDESKGGNCCEHYIATTIQGSILNIGGEYPVWSVDQVMIAHGFRESHLTFNAERFISTNPNGRPRRRKHCPSDKW